MGQILQQHIGTILMQKLLFLSSLTSIPPSISPHSSHLTVSLAFSSNDLRPSAWFCRLLLWMVCPVAWLRISFTSLPGLFSCLCQCQALDLATTQTWSFKFLNPTFSFSLLAHLWPACHFSQPFTRSAPAFWLKTFPLFHSVGRLPLIPTPFLCTNYPYTFIHSAWTSSQITSASLTSTLKFLFPCLFSVPFLKIRNPHSHHVSEAKYCWRVEVAREVGDWKIVQIGTAVNVFKLRLSTWLFFF